MCFLVPACEIKALSYCPATCHCAHELWPSRTINPIKPLSIALVTVLHHNRKITNPSLFQRGWPSSVMETILIQSLLQTKPIPEREIPKGARRGKRKGRGGTRGQDRRGEGKVKRRECGSNEQGVEGKKEIGAERWLCSLKALAALTKDQSSGPSTHTRQLTSGTPAPGDSRPSSRLCGYLYSHTHAQAHT